MGNGSQGSEINGGRSDDQKEGTVVNMTDTGSSDVDCSPSRVDGQKGRKNRRSSTADDSPKNEVAQGKALKWVRGTFCKFTKA